MGFFTWVVGCAHIYVGTPRFEKAISISHPMQLEPPVQLFA